VTITRGRVRDLLGARGERVDDRVLEEIAEDAPLVAEAAGVHVECAIKVLGVLGGWDLPPERWGS
jgi:hypothetical protein